MQCLCCEWGIGLDYGTWPPRGKPFDMLNWVFDMRNFACFYLIWVVWTLYACHYPCVKSISSYILSNLLVSILFFALIWQAQGLCGRPMQAIVLLLMTDTNYAKYVCWAYS